MLPTGHAELRGTLLLQDGWSPARSVFLSRHSRARCNVPCKVLAIAHATVTLFSFSCFVPPRLRRCPLRPCVLFCAFCRGAILGPARFSDSVVTLGAWGRSPVVRPFVLDARRQRCFLSFLCFAFASPFCGVCGAPRILKILDAQSRWSHRSGLERVIPPVPRKSDSQGCALRCSGGGF